MAIVGNRNSKMANV